MPVPSALSEWGLGAGEEATIALALTRNGALAVVDDTDERRAARALGVDATGTTGVVLQAKKDGRLAQMAPVLRDVGIYLPKRSVLTELLESVGEAWL